MNPDSFTASQVRALFRVASEADGPAPASQTLKAADLSATLLEMTRGRGAADGHLLDRATDPQTPVEELLRLKQLAKALIKQAPDGHHRDAARLLYHVAVAAALVRHGATISGRAPHKQELVYRAIAAQWPGHAIGDLLCEAAARAAALSSSGSR